MAETPEQRAARYQRAKEEEELGAETVFPDGYEDWTWGELEHLARTEIERLRAALDALSAASLTACPLCEAMDVSDAEIAACPESGCPLRAVAEARRGA